MYMRRLCLLAVVAASKAALLSPQVLLENPTDLSQTSKAPPGPTTGNLIFQAVSNLLQHWPNTKYVNGHTVAFASIAPGTTLYHGRSLAGGFNMSEPEWLATDPEHSYVFCRGNCHLLSFVTTRKLRLAYFDGSSASNMVSGTLDSQDIMIWGEVRGDKVWGEQERINEACKWGKNYGLDGFVRMEMDFEVMMCNFVDGLLLASNSSIMAPKHDTFRPFDSESINETPEDPRYPPGYPPGNPPPGRGSGRGPGRGPGGPGRGPGRNWPEPVIPPGWKGSLRTGSSVSFEVVHAGTWHNHIPGETRVHVDYSRLISFFDPTFTSLVQARANTTKSKYRILGISVEDAKDARDQMIDIFSRSGEGSGIDWGSIVRVIIERYSGRLELVQHLLKPSETRNVTEQAAQVRAQILTMLTPYMLTAAIPSNETTPDRSWIAPVVDHCATMLTSWAPHDALTRQEAVVKNAIEEVQRQICHVIGDIWVDAFEVETAPVKRTRKLLEKWSADINWLMRWLDWSIWDTCKPGCGPEEMCYIPTWPWVGGWRGKDEEVDMTPRCVTRLEPYDFQTF